MSRLLQLFRVISCSLPSSRYEGHSAPQREAVQILPNQRGGAVTGQSGQKPHRRQKQQENAASETSIRSHNVGIFLNQLREDTDMHWGTYAFKTHNNLIKDFESLIMLCQNFKKHLTFIYISCYLHIYFPLISPLFTL